jgi:hypothetical protein
LISDVFAVAKWEFSRNESLRLFKGQFKFKVIEAENIICLIFYFILCDCWHSGLRKISAKVFPARILVIRCLILFGVLYL